MFPFLFRPGEDRSKPFMDRVPTVEEIIPVLPGGPAAYDPCFLQFFQLPENASNVSLGVAGDQPRIEGLIGVPEKKCERPEQSA